MAALIISLLQKSSTATKIANLESNNRAPKSRVKVDDDQQSAEPVFVAIDLGQLCMGVVHEKPSTIGSDKRIEDRRCKEY